MNMSSHTSPDASEESRKSPSSPQHNEQPKQERKYETEETSRVCEECQQIDFSKVFELDMASLHMAKGKGILIAQLGERIREPPSNDCSLCILFFDVRMSTVQHSVASKFELRAYSYLQSTPQLKFRGKARAIDFPQLIVVPADRLLKLPELLRHVEKVGSLFVKNSRDVSESVICPRLIERHVDFSIVKEWVSYCLCNHGALCTSAAKPASGMKVIDCEGASPAIVLAPQSCSYAALSYVWGQPSTERDDFTLKETKNIAYLPASLPCTITDSIAVCKSLGIRYLWVDRYCIDQSNTEEVHEQVSQMDSIYENSAITLIAATGWDAESGLPGVGSTQRKTSSAVRLGEFEVLSTMPHPFWEIPRTRWATRGWTFQEAVLSRRRLVFTHYQIYFECGSMNCCESPKVKLDFVNRKPKDTRYAFMRPGLFGAANAFNKVDKHTQTPRAGIVRAHTLIHDFTGRSLTFEADSIKAFAGILRKWSVQKPPIPHIWGLPFWPFWYYAADSSAREVGIEQLAQSLLWKHQGPSRRRPGFPSWSWAGWEGRVSFPQHQPSLYLWSEVILEDCNGATQRIESWFDHPMGEAVLSVLSYPHALWLEGFVVSPKALRFDFGFEMATQKNKQLTETWHWPTMGFGEYRLQFVFVGFGKHFMYQSQFMEENDILVPEVYIYLSDPFCSAQKMPDWLKTGKIELLVISSTQSSMRGLVIDNRLGPVSRIGTWEAFQPCAKVFLNMLKLWESAFNSDWSDWIVVRKVRLT
jgi:hypothetical protein